MGRVPGHPATCCLTHLLDPSLTLEMCCGPGVARQDPSCMPAFSTLELWEKDHSGPTSQMRKGESRTEISGLLPTLSQEAKQGLQSVSPVLTHCVRFSEETRTNSLDRTLKADQRHKWLHPSLALVNSWLFLVVDFTTPGINQNANVWAHL